jgi:hypothetical protein
MSIEEASHVCRLVEEGLVPYVPSGTDELATCPPFPFPVVGGLVPDGWELVGQRWLVLTGNTGSDGLALTGDEFRRSLAGYIRRNPGHGFGVVEQDEGEAVVAAFRRVEER